MQEQSFSSAESLRLIDSMINKARNRFSENGHLYLVWGWSIFICALLEFSAAQWKWFNYSHSVWMLTLIPWAYMMVFLAKRKKTESVRTYTDEIASQVWLVFVVLMFLIGFVLRKYQAFGALYPSFLALYGMPTFLSGVILRFRPLQAGAIACWLLAVVAMFIALPYQVLTLAAAVVAAWIIPGYLLQQKFRAENRK